MSFPEVILWQRLRGQKINGVKFRRQHSIGPYIVDFYCKELQLILEVDGWSHDLQIHYDDCREKFLEDHNFKVYHIQVDRLLKDLDGVLIELEQLIEEIQHQS
jgi:very-short-patch-repair endonuclease